MDESAGRNGPSEWTVELAIDSSLLRVTDGANSRWLVIETTPACHSRLIAETAAWPGTHVETVEGETGLMTVRREGGLLVDGLRQAGGLPVRQAVGVLDEVLEVLESAPQAPSGASRIALRSFALDRSGRAVLIPGRFREGPLRTDTAELGELLHLALTGRTWEETGLPLSVSLPSIAPAVEQLVTDLLTDGSTELGDLRSRVRALEPERERDFLPAEPGVSDDDAPTGTFSADLVSELRAAPAHVRSRRDAQRPRRPLPSTRPDRQSSRKGRRKARGKAKKPQRWGILLLCAVAATVGCVLMFQSAPDVRASAEDVDDPVLLVEQSQSADPAHAVLVLTQDRVKAFEAGDRNMLRELTVPQSPAALADEQQHVGECDECVSGVQIDDLEVIQAPQVNPAAGDHAVVWGTMHASNSTPQRLSFTLEWFDGGWRVHSVEAI